MKIGLRYIEGAIPKEDIDYFKKIMNEKGIDFRAYDYGGRPQASFDELLGVISIFLDGSIISSIVQTIGSNAVWDTIKLMIKKVWLRIHGKKYSKVTSKGVEEKEVTLSVRVNLKTDEYFFKIEGMKDLNELERAMDKILTCIEDRKLNNDNNKIFEGNFDRESDKWIVKDFLKEMLEKQNKK